MIDWLTIPDLHIRKNIIVRIVLITTLAARAFFMPGFWFSSSLYDLLKHPAAREKKKPSGAQGNWSPQLSKNLFRRSKWSCTSRGTPLMRCRLIRTIHEVTAIAWLKLMSNIGWLWDNQSNGLVRSFATWAELRKMISINPGLVTLATHMFCLYVIQDYG